MKKVLLLAVLFLPVKLWATATVTVTLFQPAGGQPPNTYLRVDIQNCLTPRVPSTGFIMPKSQTFLPNKTTGIATAVIFENASVACGSIMGESYYTFFVVQNGTATSLGSYSIVPGGYALSSLPPLNPLPPPSNPNSPPIPIAPPAYAVQFANASANGVQADATITINPETHTLNIPNLSVANLSSQTTITSPLGFVGPLTGDVTGDLHGNAATATMAETATLADSATNAATATHAQNIPSDLSSQSTSSPNSSQFTVMNGITNANTLVGADIGAKINSLSSKVGKLWIPDGNYSFSTTINITSTASFTGFEIDCQSTHTTLNYTGSGDAIFIKTGIAFFPGVVIRNCQIAGTVSGNSGIHIQQSNGILLENVLVSGFLKVGARGIYNQGSLNEQLINVNLVDNYDNLYNTGDSASAVQTNTMTMYGGILQNALHLNYTEGGSSIFGRDQNNKLYGVIMEQSRAGAAQVLMENCDSCAIRDSYFEAFGSFSGSQVIIGNQVGTNLGSNTNQTPKEFVIDGGISFTPAGNAFITLYNASGLSVVNASEQGAPTFFINAVTSPTVGITGPLTVSGLVTGGIANVPSNIFSLHSQNMSTNTYTSGTFAATAVCSASANTTGVVYGGTTTGNASCGGGSAAGCLSICVNGVAHWTPYF